MKDRGNQKIDDENNTKTWRGKVSRKFLSKNGMPLEGFTLGALGGTIGGIKAYQSLTEAFNYAPGGAAAIAIIGGITIVGATPMLYDLFFNHSKK